MDPQVLLGRSAMPHLCPLLGFARSPWGMPGSACHARQDRAQCSREPNRWGGVSAPHAAPAQARGTRTSAAPSRPALPLTLYQKPEARPGCPTHDLAWASGPCGRAGGRGRPWCTGLRPRWRRRLQSPSREPGAGPGKEWGRLGTRRHEACAALMRFH
ncbi:hypothetical protein KIL84_000299 [Mauremys mutica]|uniref:Uncharacterized protein n=1 Tax=Mauremys mutica TaxID=74926 RepID=A0A9D3XFK9_9SAUR|nr:hypothetical protein KIL84_000299 [Mauremys mutica]